MDWGTLAATVSGGLVAISGTVLADQLRGRREDGRGLGARRRAVYIEFVTAAGVCHARLVHLARDPSAEPGLAEATRAALSEAGIHEVRERLFLDASAAVAGAGQAMFEALRALRQAVAAGAAMDSPAFHDVYHPYLGAVWSYRVAVRRELEGLSLTPGVFGWRTWEGRERCAVCQAPDGAAG